MHVNRDSKYMAHQLYPVQKWLRGAMGRSVVSTKRLVVQLPLRYTQISEKQLHGEFCQENCTRHISRLFSMQYSCPWEPGLDPHSMSDISPYGPHQDRKTRTHTHTYTHIAWPCSIWVCLFCCFYLKTRALSQWPMKHSHRWFLNASMDIKRWWKNKISQMKAEAALRRR